MTSAEAATLTLAIFAAAGALPVRMISGFRPATLFMAPLAGAFLAAVAGALTVLVDGSELNWFVPLAIAVNAAAMASWLARRESRRTSKTTPHLIAWMWWTAVLGVLAIAGVSAWSLRSLSNVDLGAEARLVWIAHATWIHSGHKAALAALRNPALALSHSTYPPLPGATIALGWSITGVMTNRSGQIVLAVLTGCAVAAGGAAIFESGMLASARSGDTRIPAMRIGVSLAAAAAGVAWVLGAFGLAGSGATDGSVDLLAASCAVGAAGMGLVLPCSGENSRAAAVLGLTAALTTDEGTAAAVIVFLVMALRWLAASRRRSRARELRIVGRRGLAAALACAVGIAGALIWPAGTVVRRATRDYFLTGPRVGSLLNRGHATWSVMSGALHLGGLALAIGFVATIVLGKWRRSVGLGSDGWIWAVGVLEVAAVCALYELGHAPVKAWFDSTGGESALFAQCLALGLIAWWCVAGLAITAGAPPPSHPTAQRAPSPPTTAVDG